MRPFNCPTIASVQDGYSEAGGRIKNAPVEGLSRRRRDNRQSGFRCQAQRTALYCCDQLKASNFQKGSFDHAEAVKVAVVLQDAK